uniref:Secreted protein n=1 Tax=Cacopsylla melanoneura TaxID=428564 RepID=A0A8D8TDC8_9HEMI
MKHFTIFFLFTLLQRFLFSDCIVVSLQYLPMYYVCHYILCIPTYVLCTYYIKYLHTLLFQNIRVAVFLFSHEFPSIALEVNACEMYGRRDRHSGRVSCKPGIKKFRQCVLVQYRV